MRIVTVSAYGQPARRIDQNDGRERLLSWVIERTAREGWGPLDVMLLPAGFFFGELVLGPLGCAARQRLIAGSQVGGTIRRAGVRLHESSGAALAVGLDTRSYLRGFRGDQMMIATSGDQIIGVARKVFTSPIDTRASPGRPYLIFPHDAAPEGRIVSLPGGPVAICACYDGFAFSRQIAKEAAHRPYTLVGGAAQRLPSRAGAAIVEQLRRTLLESEADVALIGIHGFDAPGRETRWQRHGIASASAALNGALAVGAAHFRHWLPEPDELDHATLASRRVGARHLRLGIHRKARRAPASKGLFVTVPGSNTLCATVRLFEV